MRLVAALAVVLWTGTAFAHPGSHLHPHGGESVGIGLALLILAATVAIAGLPHVLRRVRVRGRRD